MKPIIIIVLLSILLEANGQVGEYSKYVKDNLINKKQTLKTNGDKKEIVYLGKIKDNNGKALFYLLSIYSEVQAAIIIHGHSNVIYLDNKKVFKKQFELGSPDELPIKLEDNRLYFHHINIRTKRKQTYVNHVGMQMPKVLCVGSNECY